jgi:hypothetical protein
MEILSKEQWYTFLDENKHILNGAIVFKPSEFYQLIDPTGLWIIRNTKIPNARLIGIINFSFFTINKFKKEYGNLVMEEVHNFSKVIDENNCIIRGSTDGVHTDADQTVGLTHREIKNWKSYTPCRMRLIMGKYWDEVLDWLDLFPNHIVEFSLFNKPVGIKRYPLVIWEIRKY